MKKQVRTGQSSIEFLVITGVGLFLISAVAIGFLSYTKSTGDTVVFSQVNDLSAAILGQASTVYSWGGYSWVTVDAVMPKGIVGAYTVENNTLVFDIETEKGLVSQPFFSTTPISGLRTVGSRSYIDNGTITIHEGASKFRITSLGSVVQIQAVG